MENKGTEYRVNYDETVKISFQDMRLDCVNTDTFDIESVESELERIFAENLPKYLSDDAQFMAQVDVNTICGKFRLDFVVQCNGQKYAFECDGKEFHNESRDEWRDAMILGAGAVDFIYRLRGSDLYYHTEDCLYVISKWNPSIFSQRGLINLTTLASEEARHWHDSTDDNTIARISYRDDSNTLSPHRIHVERRCRENPKGQNIFWKNIFTYAIKHGGGNLDMLIQQYRNG
jgi:hypothetical protein